MLALMCACADSATDQAAKTELVVLVDSNLARCLQLLFGVMLPQRNQEWGVSAVSSIPCTLRISACLPLLPLQELVHRTFAHATQDLFCMADMRCPRPLIESCLKGLVPMQEETAGGASLHNAQECIEVWKHVGPYAESLETDGKMLGRLQGARGVSQIRTLKYPCMDK